MSSLFLSSIYTRLAAVFIILAVLYFLIYLVI